MALSIVQQAGGASKSLASGGTFTVTPTSGTTPGNLLLVAIYGAVGGTYAVSDSASDSYTLVGQGTSQLLNFWRLHPAAHTTSVTSFTIHNISGSTANTCAIILEVSGTPAGPTFSGTCYTESIDVGTEASSSTGSSSAPTVTTAAVNSTINTLVCNFVGWGGTATLSAGTGWTAFTPRGTSGGSASTNNQFGGEYKIVSSPTAPATYTASPTLSKSESWISAILCVNGADASLTDASAPQFVAATTSQGSTLVSSISLNVPAGVSSGDFLMAALTSGGIAFSTPTGWTATTSSTDVSVFYRVASGSEPTSYTFSLSSGTGVLEGIMVDYASVNTGGTPIDQSGTGSAVGTGSFVGLGTFNAATFTPTNAHPLIVYIAVGASHESGNGYSGIVGPANSTARAGLSTTSSLAPMGWFDAVQGASPYQTGMMLAPSLTNSTGSTSGVWFVLNQGSPPVNQIPQLEGPRLVLDAVRRASIW